MLHNIKKLYKKYIPPLIDATGFYDRSLSSSERQYLVPMYHRIIKNSNDDPFGLGMCVSEKCFEQQLEYFSNNYKPVMLSDYVSKGYDVGDPVNHVTLTFDDGYKDTLDHALPIIKKYGLKAAVFVCIYSLQNDGNYWWDIIINSVKKSDKKYLETKDLGLDLPGNLSVHGQSVFTNLTKILNAIKKKSHSEAYTISKKIRDRLIESGEEDFVDKLSEDDIVRLYKSGVEIGAHTMSHPDLRMLPESEIISEMSKSKSVLEEIIGDKISGFAYPSGYYNEQVVNLVKKCDYKYALSVDKGLNYPFKKYTIERLSMPDTNLSDMKRCIFDNLDR